MCCVSSTGVTTGKVLRVGMKDGWMDEGRQIWINGWLDEWMDEKGNE